MDKFREGGIVYHKATRLRCVIIRLNDDGTIKVRDEKDSEKDYYPQELETKEEIDAKNDAEIAAMNQSNKDRDTGFGY
jgi:hypothetical protein